MVDAFNTWGMWHLDYHRLGTNSDRFNGHGRWPSIDLKVLGFRNRLVSGVQLYVWTNAVSFFVCVYLVLSTLAWAYFGVNLTLPCVFKTLFGFQCPGCGLTTAGTQILHGDFSAACDTNPLIFIVIPAFTFFVAQDFWRFYKTL